MAGIVAVLLTRGANPNAVSDRPNPLGDLVAGRPDVMAARADLQAGPYYERDGFGMTYLGFRAQSDVPILNNGVPLLRQREAQAVLDRYERARRIVAESSQDFDDTLPVELQRLEEQFKAGEVDGRLAPRRAPS